MKFEGTKTLPSLEFDEDKGQIKIYGRSVDVEAKDNFWDPLLNHLEKYLDEPKDIVVSIDLEFFSTRSSKSILEMFKLIEKKTVKENQKEFIIDWIYDDDELLEAGEDYELMVPKANFKFIKKLSWN